MARDFGRVVHNFEDLVSYLETWVHDLLVEVLYSLLFVHYRLEIGLLPFSSMRSNLV